eukprot:TRINITY_DN12889_c3_g1_i1.p1 TRINITY_DN12889_c3_g1~~TRINITY_DN12889_c3_g1_i1.p1  ORF type:complete len:359 (+),score=74.06 TRINITY_DN12889_c3_g1_i1:50-1078(+)
MTSLPVFNEVITVFDPTNKKGYELQYGGAKSEVFPTMGLQIYFEQRRVGGCKRVFLCKKFQGRICRAHEMCNSIHACRKKVAEMRALYPSSENESEITVLCLPDGEKIKVPISKTEYTVGRQAGEGTLCQDHEVRACTRGQSCTLIHVDPRHIHSLRALWKSPCCSQPACPSKTSVPIDYPKINGQDWNSFSMNGSSPQPRDGLAHTKGLIEVCGSGVVSNGCLQLSHAKLCRPHLRMQCKWGVECNNVHICRKRMPQGVSPVPSSQTSPVGSPGVSPHTKAHAQPQAAIDSPPSSVACSSNSDCSASDDEVNDKTATPLSPLLKEFRNALLPVGGLHFSFQ